MLMLCTGGHLPGGWGENAPTLTTIELRKRGDLAMVHRAVVNGWEVPAHIRLQLVEQLGPALDAATDDRQITANRTFARGM
jgi:hypothetical protein